MKDYAKTASNKKKSNKNFIIFMSAFIVVILSLIWGGVVLVHKRHHRRQQLIQAAVDKKTTKHKQRYHHKKHSIAQPHFDFYHLLSEIKVPTLHAAKSAAQSTMQKTYNFFLQISTTKDENAAKYLQQELHDNKETPLDTQLLEVSSSDGSLRYRIMAGPYDDVVVAQRIQNELRLQGRDSLLIKRLVKDPSSEDDN